MAAINTLNPLESKIRDLATAGLGKHAGTVVGILRGGDQWVAGYGSFDAGQQAPDEDAIFDIGSVTKVFTTLVLAEMVVRGEVALDMYEFLSGYKGSGDLEAVESGDVSITSICPCDQPRAPQP
jgi:hypothetical protein